jgi:hypothetical protein
MRGLERLHGQTVPLRSPDFVGPDDDSRGDRLIRMDEALARVVALG